MRRLLFSAIACTALACSNSNGPGASNGPVGLAGLWISNQAPITGGYIALRVVIAETSGVLNGSGTLTVFGCPTSPYAVTVTGARAGSAVSFTLLPQNVNLSGSFAADSITGVLTGIGCGGVTIAPPAIVLKR